MLCSQLNKSVCQIKVYCNWLHNSLVMLFSDVNSVLIVLIDCHKASSKRKIICNTFIFGGVDLHILLVMFQVLYVN